MRRRSSGIAWAGFAFWLGMAYFFYRRDLAGAAGLALLFVLAAAALALVRRLRSGRPAAPRRRPPRSDLPEFNFKNVKPKDFE